MEKIKGVSLKEIFINCFWNPDSSQEESKQLSKLDEVWKKVWEDVDKKEQNTRDGGKQFNSKSKRNNRTKGLKSMKVNATSKKVEKESSVIDVNENSRDNDKIQEI